MSLQHFVPGLRLQRKKEVDVRIPEGQLLHIEAPHYCAGAIFRQGRCVFAAPIIRWMVGKDEAQVLGYLKRKGFAFQWGRS